MKTSYNIIIIDNREKLIKLDLLEKDALVNEKLRTYCIGFDAEFISRTNYSDSFQNSNRWIIETPTNEAVCLIQIASKNYVFLIYLPAIGLPLPKRLKKIIIGEKWLKVGVGIEGDLRKICDNYKLSYFYGSFELKTLAEVGNIQKPNLANLYSLFVGKQHYKDKSQSICNWSLPLDNSKKIKYAARDAIMSYQLFYSMLKPTLENIKSKTNNVLEINIDNIEEEEEEEEEEEKDIIMVGTNLREIDIVKCSNLLLLINVSCPDFSYIEPSRNKTNYSKIRKTARAALKRCKKKENILMNQMKITLINACQLNGYSHKFCETLCKKLANDLNNLVLFDKKVINHVQNLYKNLLR